MKRVIFTQRVEVVEAYQERRDCADQRISDFIVACGFLPIPVPNKSELAEEIVKSIQPSGIVLTGGNSIVRYGGNAPERDEMDDTLIGIAVKYKIPLYGFCRGMQSLLYYFGNEMENVTGHVATRHITKLGAEKYEVNSYHNQACLKLKNNCDLVVTAQAEDGVIEAVEHKKLPIIGTMWHPEREIDFKQFDINKVNKCFNNMEVKNELQ